MSKAAVARAIEPEQTLSEKPSEQVQEERPKVWDLPLRLTHWLLALAVVGAFVTNKLGINYFRYHVWCGYTVIVLVLFRIIWGLIGSYHARFRNFIRSPSTVIQYIRDEARGRSAPHVGHNPLGAVMVVTLLAALLVQAVTGLFGNDEIFNVGPLYGYVNNELSLKLTSFHRKWFYWLIAAITIHVLAVIAHHIFRRENLVGAMISGHKSHVTTPPNEDARHARVWLAAVMIAVISLLLWWVVTHAPIATNDTGDSY
ncbi:MAG: cytochrome b/b6 domain-containing protein [Solimonas sp.]